MSAPGPGPGTGTGTAELAQAVAAADDAPVDRAVALIRPFLTDIGWFHALLRRECGRMAADPLHLPGWRASRSGTARHLVLARTERIWIAATLVEVPEGRGGRIHFSGRQALCRPLNRPLEGEMFRLVEGRAIAAGDRRWLSGELMHLDERREALRIRPGGGPCLLLRAQIAPQGPVRSQVCDGDSGAIVASAQVDEGQARTLMLLSLLRIQRRGDAASHFARALDAPLPTQRWAAMREYLALDTRGALPALAAMAGVEPDAQVRQLARATLDRIGGGPCPV